MDDMELSEERRGLVSEFISFTATSDQHRAIAFLQASDWKLSEAVELFFAEQAPTNDEGPSSNMVQEEVRAPVPSKFERLVDRSHQYEHLLRPKTKQEVTHEAFRNHRAELEEFENGPEAEGGTKGLAKLYKAPIDILFRGSFEEAKDASMNQDVWLIVNVQSATEFASCQLNCDTFSNEALKEMIKANFVFLQMYNDGPTGTRLTTYYNLNSFPCILIIDPVTGGLMRSFHGFVGPERLTEDLVEYMDCSPSSGSASRLIRNLPMNREESNTDNELDTDDSNKRKIKSDFVYSSEVGGVLEDDPKHVPQKRRSQSDERETVEFAEHKAVVSALPKQGEVETCTVGIMLPDGKRLSRLFLKDDRIEV